jgi:hypothetical protein
MYISAQLVVYSPTNFCTSFEGDSVVAMLLVGFYSHLASDYRFLVCCTIRWVVFSREVSRQDSVKEVYMGRLRFSWDELETQITTQWPCSFFSFLCFPCYICTSLQLGDVNELMKLLTSSFEACEQIIVISKAYFVEKMRQGFIHSCSWIIWGWEEETVYFWK